MRLCRCNKQGFYDVEQYVKQKFLQATWPDVLNTILLLTNLVTKIKSMHLLIVDTRSNKIINYVHKARFRLFRKRRANF